MVMGSAERLAPTATRSGVDGVMVMGSAERLAPTATRSGVDGVVGEVPLTLAADTIVPAAQGITPYMPCGAPLGD